eukprot:scaffold7752_cov101-Isochrysis_galbana.AAC.3
MLVRPPCAKPRPHSRLLDTTAGGLEGVLGVWHMGAEWHMGPDGDGGTDRSAQRPRPFTHVRCLDMHTQRWCVGGGWWMCGCTPASDSPAKGGRKELCYLQACRLFACRKPTEKMAVFRSFSIGRMGRWLALSVVGLWLGVALLVG